MKSFKQFQNQINELFDKPARWKLDIADEEQLIYKSNIDGKELAVDFVRVDDISWHMTFTVDRKLSITGKGDEVKVFSTVVDIMSNFVKDENPYQFTFFAEKTQEHGSSRVRLYNRLIKRFAASHGYRLTDKDDRGQHVYYTLIKV